MSVSERRGDVVYTPDWVAQDMVRFFNPSGRILEPCRGDGAFMRHLPACAEWCEIAEGRDFFVRSEPVDWIIGNPPYSLTRPWFRHSYTLAADIVYLVPLRNVFSGYGFLDEIRRFGGIPNIRVYGTGGSLGFPMGNAVGAIHMRRGYDGPTRLTFYHPSRPDSAAADLFSPAPPAADERRAA